MAFVMYLAWVISFMPLPKADPPAAIDPARLDARGLQDHVSKGVPTRRSAPVAERAAPAPARRAARA